MESTTVFFSVRNDNSHENYGERLKYSSTRAVKRGQFIEETFGEYIILSPSYTNKYLQNGRKDDDDRDQNERIRSSCEIRDMVIPWPSVLHSTMVSSSL